MKTTSPLQIAPAALSRKDAAAFLSLSVSTLEKLVREGALPKPRLLAGRRVAWIRAELESWLIKRPESELLPPENTGASKPKHKTPNAYPMS